MDLPSQLQNRTTQAVVAGVLLLGAGVGGGRVLGYVVEPEECSQARVDLAACTARDELILESLEEAKRAIMALQADLQECEANP